MRNQISSLSSKFLRFLHDHTILALSILLFAGMFLILGNLFFLAQKTNEDLAVQPRVPLDDNWRLLFTTALATAVLAYGLIEWASKEKDEPLARSPQPWIRLGGAAALLVVGFLGSSLNAGWLVALVAAILLVQVGLDVATRIKRPEPELIGVASGG